MVGPRASPRRPFTRFVRTNSRRPSPTRARRSRRETLRPARATPRLREETDPLTADLRRLHVTVTAAFLAKVDAARDGLSHARPGATTEEVLEAALDLLLEKQARAKALVKRPRLAVAGPLQRASPSRCTDGDPGHEP